MKRLPFPTRALFAIDDALHWLGDKTGMWFLMDVAMWFTTGPVGEWIMRPAVRAVPVGTTVAWLDCKTGTLTYIVGGEGWPVIKPKGSPC